MDKTVDSGSTDRGSIPLRDARLKRWFFTISLKLFAGIMEGSMKIGSVQLENNVFLAPMAGITDIPFRTLCAKQGCGLVYTEMVSAKGMHYNDEKSIEIAAVDACENAAAVQIFGSEPDIMAEAAERLNLTDAVLIDINMGCPTPKITKNGEGSALMKKPYLAGKIIKAVCGVSKKPVTVKIRKGWDNESINAVEIACIAEESGAKAVAVHGRTREQFYSGKADWDIIKRVKEEISIPVIGNGDILNPEDAKRMMEHTGCDAVMVGRGAQGNPWIFKRILHYLDTGELLPEPDIRQRIHMIIRHMEMAVKLNGEYQAVREMRKHVAWYIKGLHKAAAVRERIFKMGSAGEIIALLNEYADYLDN
jgi:tRNA-dihydrouridine synthase B